MSSAPGNKEFAETVTGLIAGDFSRLDPLFVSTSGKEGRCKIIEWFEAGLFETEPRALAEAFSCACFNGRTDVVRYFLDHGVSREGGDNTGMGAIHWAVNRGQLEVTRMLIAADWPLEHQNMYGGTALGAAVWSAIHEPKAKHLEIIAELIRGGASLNEVEYPTGHAGVDEVLRRHGFRK
jgi:hypothetical protein